MSGGDDDDGVLAFPGPSADAELIGAIEAMLFAVGDPVPVTALAEASGRSNDEVRSALRALEVQRRDGGVVLEQVGGGWQLRTSARHAGVVHRALGTRPQKLSRPALEVLAIVAWQQPVARSEIERVRGVDSGGVLKTLLERGLVRTAGRSDDPGRPLLYRTTAAFLELFSLPDLSALPTLAEREALVRARAPDAAPAEPGPTIVLVAEDEPG